MYVEECAAGSGRSSDSFTLSRVVVGTTIVQIDRRASRERWRTRSVEEGTRRSSPRPTGRVEQSGPTVGLCRKKTKSRGVNIIRAREGHRPPWTPAKYNRHALTTFRLFFFFLLPSRCSPVVCGTSREASWSLFLHSLRELLFSLRNSSNVLDFPPSFARSCEQHPLPKEFSRTKNTSFRILRPWVKLTRKLELIDV